jgi:hypothetical protein
MTRDTEHASAPMLDYQLRLDLPLLREQKAALLVLVSRGPDDNPLWGLVHLLDDLQDQAEERHGLPEHTVIGPEPDRNATTFPPED